MLRLMELSPSSTKINLTTLLPRWLRLPMLIYPTKWIPSLINFLLFSEHLLSSQTKSLSLRFLRILLPPLNLFLQLKKPFLRQLKPLARLLRNSRTPRLHRLKRFPPRLRRLTFKQSLIRKTLNHLNPFLLKRKRLLLFLRTPKFAFIPKLSFVEVLAILRPKSLLSINVFPLTKPPKVSIVLWVGSPLKAIWSSRSQTPFHSNSF